MQIMSMFSSCAIIIYFTAWRCHQRVKSGGWLTSLWVVFGRRVLIIPKLFLCFLLNNYMYPESCLLHSVDLISTIIMLYANNVVFSAITATLCKVTFFIRRCARDSMKYLFKLSMCDVITYRYWKTFSVFSCSEYFNCNLRYLKNCINLWDILT